LGTQHIIKTNKAKHTRRKLKGLHRKRGADPRCKQNVSSLWFFWDSHRVSIAILEIDIS